MHEAFQVRTCLPACPINPPACWKKHSERLPMALLGLVAVHGAPALVQPLDSLPPFSSLSSAGQTFDYISQQGNFGWVSRQAGECLRADGRWWMCAWLGMGVLAAAAAAGFSGRLDAAARECLMPL